MDRYVAIEEPGLYTVRAHFFPRLSSVPDRDALHSNVINVNIRPGETPEIRQNARFEAIVTQELQRERLSPDDVVRFMLEASQQGNWERFFLYLNVERIYRQLPARDARWRRLSAEDQRQELIVFRDELRNRNVDRDSDLVLIPDDFRIIQTEYTPTEGSVVAELRFDFDRYREVKRYTYQLNRRNGFWEIVTYSVTNLPNEAITQ